MKRRPIQSRSIALILTLIYILGLGLGAWVVCFLVSGAKQEHFVAMTYSFVEQYTTTGIVDPEPLSGRAAIIYGTDGAVLAQFEEKGYPIYFDFAAGGQKSVPKVLEGEETLRLILFAPNATTLRYTSLMYVGVPVVEDGEITGALFWVQELRDLLETLLAVLCTFTVVFAVVTVFVLLHQRMQRKYEQLRRDYVDNITHELKTPIASIKALAEALSDGMEKSPADRNVYYGMILREANRQERMVCDALELSKLQSYRVSMKKRAVDAKNVFAPVLEKYESLCDLMGISFVVEKVGDLPRLLTDETYIQAVLDALLGNAVKFVPENGEIRVSAHLARRKAVFCVEDNGKGIPREDLPYIFERFYKGHRSDNESGSGLGLAIAREITDNMKEKIWVESEEGVGTRAYFTVSLA